MIQVRVYQAIATVILAIPIGSTGFAQHHWNQHGTSSPSPAQQYRQAVNPNYHPSAPIEYRPDLYHELHQPGYSQVHQSAHYGGSVPNSIVMAGSTQETLLVPALPQQIGLTSGNCEPCIQGTDCTIQHDALREDRELRWRDVGSLDFQPLRHGEYIGPVRLPAMLEYRIRVGDEMEFIYTLSREKQGDDYRLMVGDELMIESATDESIRRGDFTKGVEIQADGTLPLRLIGSIPAEGKTLAQLRRDIDNAYKAYLREPAIDVTPVKTNTRLQDLRQAISNFVGISGAQSVNARVNPDGRIQLPLVGGIQVVGMTLEEAKREINLLYRQRVIGVELEPRLLNQAPHFVYVFGEVNRPGRYEIPQPTTVTQALAMAEGLRLGANNRQIVVFRRAEDWRLIATMLDVRGAHLAKRPNPADEIWLRDNDLIIVPPGPVRVFNNFVRQTFTEGVYGLIPPGIFINVQ